MVFVREDSPSKPISLEELPIEEVYPELKICKKK